MGFFAVDEGGLTFPFRNPVKHLFSQKKKKDARHNCLVIACRLPPSAHDLGDISVQENTQYEKHQLYDRCVFVMSFD